MKPKVYIETSVVSYFTSWPSRDVVMAAHQALTHEWWRNGLPRFQPVISQFVLDEVQAGDRVAAKLRVEALAGIAMITAPAADVEQVVKQLMARRALPPNARYDALHVALCACAGVEFLVTWNYKHLANASKLALVERVCRECGYEPPRIATPSELMEA